MQFEIFLILVKRKSILTFDGLPRGSYKSLSSDSKFVAELPSISTWVAIENN